MTTNIVLISDDLERNLTHDLTLSHKNEAFFDIEENTNDTFYIKLFLSNVYLTLGNHTVNDYIDYFNIKPDTNGSKIPFYHDSVSYMCDIDGVTYHLKFFNGELCLINLSRNDDDYYINYNSQLFDNVFFKFKPFYINKVNRDIQKLLSEYLSRTVTNRIYDDEGVPIYDIDDIINIMLVYHNCRSYAFISGAVGSMSPKTVSLIKILGLKCIPNYGSDEMFITKNKTDIKKFDMKDRGKKLGYISYMYDDWHDLTKTRYVAKLNLKLGDFFDGSDQVGPVEVFNIENLKAEEVRDHYTKMSEIFGIMLKAYIDTSSLTVEVYKI